MQQKLYQMQSSLPHLQGHPARVSDAPSSDAQRWPRARLRLRRTASRTDRKAEYVDPLKLSPSGPSGAPGGLNTRPLQSFIYKPEKIEEGPVRALLNRLETLTKKEIISYTTGFRLNDSSTSSAAGQGTKGS